MKLFGMTKTDPSVKVDIKPPHAAWQERAQAFVAYAQRQLRSPEGQPVLEYLHTQRGLTDETIYAWNLGYNPRDHWDDPCRWGLGGSKRIWLPRGVVIPGTRGEAIWYLKIRRPLPNDALAQAIGAVDHLPDMKYCGPRGGRTMLFGVDYFVGLPILFLVEGEFDALLVWHMASDLCDVACLGGAKHHLDALDAIDLIRTWAILAAYDIDDAGKCGSAYLHSTSRRVKVVEPPAHDLTDYWRQGGDLRAWIADVVAKYMEQLLDRLDDRRHAELFVKWLEIYERALNARKATSDYAGSHDTE